MTLRILMCVVAAWSVAIGATNDGIITGSVRETASGEPLRGATILVDGTKRGAISDPKGNFTIKNIAAGTYALTVRYIGYETKRIAGVVVEPGKTTRVSVVLDRDRQLVARDVVVEARRTNETQAALLAQRKNSAQVTDGISTEEITKLPDNDAGQALRRVSGVTLASDKFLVVRGTGDRYNNAMLNGIPLTSTEPDKKAFSYDLFPSSLLESATITKTFTPDLPGNFTGGLVQLSTIEFPSQSSLKVSFSSSINDNAFLQPNRYISAPGGRWDWLGFDDGTRSSLPAGMPTDRRQMSALLSAVRNPYDTTGARQRWTQLSKSFNNQNWQQRQRTLAMPNSSISLAYTDVASIAGTELGIVASLVYSNSWSISTLERNGILADRSTWFRTSGYNPSRTTTLGGMLSLSLRASQYSTLSVQTVFNHSADEDVVVLNGQDYVRIFDTKQLSMQYVEKRLLSVMVSGDHTLPMLSNAALDWKVGYTSTGREEPDFRRFRFARQTPNDESYVEPYASDIISFTPLGQGDGVRAGRFFSQLDERAYTGAFNLQLPLGSVKLKTGMLTEHRQRQFTARSFTYVPGPEFSLDYAVFTLPDSVQWADPSGIFRPENFGPQGIGISEDSRLADAYSARERLYAGYIMADYSFDQLGLPLRIIGGVRYEDNRQQLNSYDLSDRPVTVDVYTRDWLPALSVVVGLTPTMNLRLAASQTVARPSLREFAPFAFYDFSTQSQVMGNPNLTRALIANGDVRWEWFPSPGEVLSAGVFVKRFLHAIEETIYLEQQEIARTFRNAEGPALNYGAEIELRKRLDVLGSWGQHLTLSLNYARIISQVEVTQGGQLDRRPMWGQSPYTFNALLTAAIPELDATVSIGYNVFGRRIVLVGLRNAYQFDDPHTYELPRDVVDLTVTKAFGAFQVRLSIRDLLNQPLRWEQGGTIVQSTIRGRSLGIGLSYRL
ncbi:MAG: outer membrane protein [Candidatus Kapaibacterium sp.]|nr:MAG: outer membrane protein [Candidatus Kapabacteria bacterium]